MNTEKYMYRNERTGILRARFMVPFLIVLISVVYMIFLRPRLMPNMGTVPIELGLDGIVFFLLIICLFTIVFTLVITLIMALVTRNFYKVKQWLLKIRTQVVVALILALIMTAAVFASQQLTYTPPILDHNGNVLTGSVAKLEKVKVNGADEWITIRGKSTKNPVLLFLAGGPGGSQLAATRNRLKDLEDNFVVVSWDQPGSCKSYNALPISSITPKRYVSDAHKLTQYLCKKFNKKKIYVVGESWGSALGIMLVQRYPELFSAFIGTGQMVSFKKAEILDYKKALKIAKEAGDKKEIEKLKKQGMPPYYGNNITWKEAAYINYLSDYMTKDPDISNPGYNTLKDLSSPEYGLYDKAAFFLGLYYTFSHVYQQLYSIDFTKQAAKINVPVYFIEGRHDVNAPPTLVQEYYKVLKAPKKKFIWFEHSGHDAWMNESHKFVDTMVNIVLKETK